MDRRTAARVAPTAEPTASTCSSDSAVIFTPVVPVDHVADDRESGAASSARCREDGQAYVAHPPSRAARPVVPVRKVGGCFFFCAARSRLSWPVLHMESSSRLRHHRRSLRWRVPTHRPVPHAACLVTHTFAWLHKRPACNAQSSVCSGPATNSRPMRRCGDRWNSHMAIRVPRCGSSDR
jgi:hypothetical protein